jgi:hypothetical protein
MVRTDVTGQDTGSQCWLRVERPNGQIGFSDNTAGRPVLSRNWTACEIVGKVDSDAERVLFGARLNGVGRMWVDDFELSVADADGIWQSLDIANPSFERHVEQNPVGWGHDNPFGYSHRVVPEPLTGRFSMMVQSVPVTRDQYYPVGWSADGRFVYASDRAGERIVAISSAGGLARSILSDWPEKLKLESASVAPDGRKVVLSLSRARSDAWIADNVALGRE